MKTLHRKSPSADPSILHKKEVCIVEDDPDQAAILQGMLDNCKCEVILFTTGEDALEWLMENAVDVILADVMMPGLDGWELHSRIRERGPNRQTPFIFTTCVISTSQETLMSDVPAKTLSLAKPFSRDKLLKAIARLMD